MNTIVSNDGTKIAYEKIGNGRPLVIVGGSLSDHSFYSPLAEQLANDFTVYNYDRRGRGESGDTQPYSVEREIEDLTSLINEVSEEIILYGHSAGSALSLLVAANSSSNIAKLIMADPPFTAHSENDKEASEQFSVEAAVVKELHEKGDHRSNTAQFLAGFGMSDEEINGMLDSPAGAGMIACAAALPYDYAVLGDGLVPINVAKSLDVPTSILAENYSVEAAEQLSDSIEGSELKILTTSTHEMSAVELANIIKSLI